MASRVATLLVEVASTLGKRHPDVALQQLLPLLEDDHARAAAIDILGSIGDARAVPELGRLMRGCRLGEHDLVHLADALGEIGGDEACRLLVQLRQAVTPGQRELRREIDIACRRLTASESPIDFAGPADAALVNWTLTPVTIGMLRPRETLLHCPRSRNQHGALCNMLNTLRNRYSGESWSAY